MTAQGTPEHLATVIPFPGAIVEGEGIPAASSGPPDITKRSNVISIRRRLGGKPVSGLDSPSGTDEALPRPAPGSSFPSTLSEPITYFKEEWRRSNQFRHKEPHEH